VSRRDHFTYTRQQIEALLPACFDPDFGILAAKAEQEVRSNGDPAHGGGLMAMVADVRSAWDRLDREDHRLLERRHNDGWGLDVIAASFGLENEQEAADLVDGAVDKMIHHLGG